MADLESVLEELAQGRIDLDEAESRLNRLLGEPGQTLDTLVHELDAAHSAGRIGDVDYVPLKRAMVESRHADAADGGDADEATVLATEHLPASPPPAAAGDPDRTHVDIGDAGDGLDLDAVVEALAQGRIDLDEAGARVTRLLAEPGQSFDTLVHELDAAHSAGRIGDVDYVPLKRTLVESRHAGAADGGDADEATVLATEHLSGSPPPAGTGDPESTHIDLGEEDAERTVAAGDDDQGEDEDRTIAVSPDDAERTIVRETGKSESAAADDEERTVVRETEDEDRTISVSPDDEDRTIAREPADDDKTVAVDEEDGDAPTRLATEPGGDTSDPNRGHFDLGGDTDSSGRPGSAPSAPYTTDSASSKGTAERSWTPVDAEGETIEELKGLGPGSVIKDRFVLDKVLGTGGMGKVYAARDLLKVEAKDKNPHVALKLLTEDFKQHPEAFIALQREASRQQKLAHPNIATVYDFDRIGRSGTQVFITMELMEGLPLNDFIRKKVRPKGGLSFEEALPMVQGLGAALSYAHQRNIVHSDFKPGNAFLCNDGTVKTLDFGIARAVKAPGQQEGDGEKTLFDAGELGALTPAYASLEMLQGDDPHPRDDLYALACVAYELLTGYHPYAKKPATEARDAGLVPAPIKGLKRRQWKGLMRGLAFEREKRSKDVDTFLEEFEGRLNWHKNPWVISGGMAAVLAIAAINPALDYLEDRRVEAMIAQIETGEPAAIRTTLGDLPELGASARAEVTEETRSILQDYFADRLDAAVSLEEGRYDFDQAVAVHAHAQSIFPDSARVIAMGERIEAMRDERLSELNQELIAALEEDRLLPADGGENAPSITAILEMVEAINPDHPMLEDPRIPDAYATAAQADINIAWLDQAREYLDIGLSLFPNDVDLINTRDRLQLAEEREIRRQRVEQLHASLDGRLDEMESMADFAEYEESIIELSQLAPNDNTLAHLSERLAPIAGEAIDAILENGSADAASSFAVRHGSLLRATGHHDELLRIEFALLDEDERDEVRAEFADDAREAIRAHLDRPDVHDRRWEAGLRDHLRLLAALGERGGTQLLATERDAIAEFYMDAAGDLEAEQRHSLALATLDRADTFDLQRPAIVALREDIDEARIAFLREREEATRQARIEGMKQTLQIQAQALQIDAATETYAELQQELPEDDPFLEITAAEALANAYSALAEQRADEERFREAVALTDEGLEYAPNHQVLTGERQNYIVEANSRELAELFQESRTFDTVETTRMVDEIRTYAPTRYAQLEQEYVATLAERIENIAVDDREAAERLANRATNVFPGSAILAQLREEVTPEPWTEGTAARAALGAGRLSEARIILQSALRRHPDHPEVLNFQEDFEARIENAEAVFARHEQALEDDDLDAAREYLSEARSLWSDNADFRTAAANLSERIALERWRQSRVLQRGQDIESLRAEAEVTGVDVALEDWDPIESNRPCTENLAGHGRRARAICYDLIHDRVRGPLMVVAPDGEEMPTFAISKYEISHEDWNKYCFLSGNCPVDEEVDEGLPRTGLSLAQIREFTEWLSERTGKNYRLPTSREWEYAAYANGDQPPRDFNCRVRFGGQTLKGTDFVNVTSGHMNGWGMKNYIGNSQELVTNGTDLYVRGGAYTEAHSSCDISIRRPHDGQGDELTGFRIVLEDIVEPSE